jgi:1-acyl-sn-glycerol-3-phosphate acyltransferase
MSNVWWIENIKVEYDYKKYLGPDWKPTNERPGSIVSNHQSWVDIIMHMYRQPPSHVAKASIRNVPFIGHVAEAIGSLFLQRENKE